MQPLNRALVSSLSREHPRKRKQFLCENTITHPPNKNCRRRNRPYKRRLWHPKRIDFLAGHFAARSDSDNKQHNVQSVGDILLTTEKRKEDRASGAAVGRLNNSKTSTKNKTKQPREEQPSMANSAQEPSDAIHRQPKSLSGRIPRLRKVLFPWRGRVGLGALRSWAEGAGRQAGRQALNSSHHFTRGVLFSLGCL